MSNFRTCENCKENFDWDCERTGDEGILDLQEILDCSETTITKWEKQNPNIDLHGYFCWRCTSKIGDEIEKGEQR
jgi:hypothetical protein